MVDNQDTAQATTPASAAEQSEAKEQVKAPELEIRDDPEPDAETGDAEDNSDDESTDEGDKQPKRKSSGIHRLKAENARLQAELARAQKFVPASTDETSIKGAIEQALGPRPKESDYPDYLSYERAATAYEAASFMKASDIRQEAQRLQRTEAERVQHAIEMHKERQAEARKVVPDFDATIASASNLPVAPHMSKLIVESDKSAVLQYYFAKYPNKLADLNAADPITAAREVGRLEARVSWTKPKTETKATAPIPSLKGGSSMPPDAHKAQSMKDYASIRLKELGFDK